MQKVDIIAMFAEEGYQASPDAVEVISAHGSPVELVGYILATIDESVFVVEAEHIDLDGFKVDPEKPNQNPNQNTEPESNPLETVTHTHVDPVPPSSSSTSSYSSPDSCKSDFGSDCDYEPKYS